MYIYMYPPRVFKVTSLPLRYSTTHPLALPSCIKDHVPPLRYSTTHPTLPPPVFRTTHPLPLSGIHPSSLPSCIEGPFRG